MQKYRGIHILSIAFCTLLLSACAPSAIQSSIQPVMEDQTPTPMQENTASPVPAATATAYPKGSAENPITMGIVYSNEEKQSPAAQKFVQYLADATGYIFQLTSFSDDLELLTEIDQGTVSLAWLQPVPYLYASASGSASVALLSSHYGVYYYGSQFLVNSSKDYTEYFDSKTGRTSDNPAYVLGQFSGQTPCLVDQTSLSGYVLPVGLLNESNVQFNDPILLKSHEAVIRAIYAGGICDYGATYGLSGDPRTSSSVQKDLPDVMQKVLILWQTDPIIPTMNLSYSTKLDAEIQDTITSAVLAYMDQQDGPSIISAMTDYSMENLTPIGDNAYDRLRELVEASGENLESLLK